MNKKELFLAKLLSSEELRKEFLSNPKAVLEREGLAIEDLCAVPLQAAVGSRGPAAAMGTSTCQDYCPETCHGSIGTIVGSKIGTVTRPIVFANPTLPG
jgi:hypothetical protein